MKFAFLLFILTFVSLFCRAQQSTFFIQDKTACPGSEVNVPVYAGNLGNAGAITMFFAFDTTRLNFLSIEDVNSQLSDLLYHEMSQGGKNLGVSWHSKSGFSAPGAKLFDIRFFYESGNVAIDFAEDCEIASTELEILNIDFENGVINPTVEIIDNPANATVNEWEDASFQVGGTADAAFQWQQSVDGGLTYQNLTEDQNFLGVNSMQLNILECDLYQNEYQYRCLLEKEGCQVFSDPAVLFVNPVLHSQEIILKEGWNDFSSWLNPENQEWDDFLAAILDQIIIVSDGTGIYYPQENINTLGQFNPSGGYAIKLNADAVLEINGYTNAEKTIEITTGWSMLPVICNCELDIETLLDDHLDKVIFIKEITGIEVFWPEKEIYALNKLMPGKAYLIKASDSFEAVFPWCD